MRKMIAIMTVLFSGCAAQQSAVSDRSIPRPTQNQLQVAKAAQAVVDGLNERMDNGEALTVTFLDLYLGWSRRLADAEVQVAASGDLRMQAIERHANRIVRLASRINHIAVENSTTRIHIDLLGYYLADAQRLGEIERARKAAENLH